MSKQVVVLGSSKSFGKTREAIIEILGERAEIVDLKQLNITPYDYEHNNQDDDYISLMKRIVEQEYIVLATPVYWYTMSATMKAFIDRFSDLLYIYKDIGRKLRGKKLFVIATFNTSIPRGFEDTFQQFCEYLGITYCGTAFIYSGSGNQALEDARKDVINQAKVSLN